MTITLTPEQQAWIEAHVARGEFASMEDAARQLIDAAIVDHGRRRMTAALLSGTPDT